MSNENDRSTFSIRIPTSLAQQIDSRAAVSRRTRNAEIICLLEQAIDINVMRDKKLLKDMTKVET